MSEYSAKPCKRQTRDFGHFAKMSTLLPIGLLAAVLALGAGPQRAYAADDGKKIPLDKANIFFELNHTDGDLGIHVMVDGKAWKRLKIEDPNKGKMLDIEVKGRLQKQGLTELFSESAEPPFDELAPKDFYKRFPEGTYRIFGTTLDGKKLEGSSKLTHVMPAAPDNIRISGVAAPKDCESGSVPSVGVPVVISWAPVTKSHPKVGKSAAIEIVNTEVIIEREEPAGLKINVDVPTGTKSFVVPKELTNPGQGEEYKFEILVREASGNQTATESCFKLK